MIDRAWTALLAFAAAAIVALGALTGFLMTVLSGPMEALQGALFGGAVGAGVAAMLAALVFGPAAIAALRAATRVGRRKRGGG